MKYRLVEDTMQHIIVEEFKTLKEAKKYYRDNDYEPWSEVWIENADGKVVYPKSWM